MDNVKISASAEKIIENMLTAWPSIIRSRWRKKLLLIGRQLASSKGSKELDDKTMLEVLDNWPFSEDSWRIRAALARFGGESPQLGFKGDAPGFKPTVSTWSAEPDKRIEKRKSGKIKIAAILGSPRKGGNTDILVDQMLRGAESAGAETEKVFLSKLDIKFCTGCDACTKKKIDDFCTIKDDMTPGLYRQFLESDILITGFPIYTGRESAMLANYHDRLYGLGRPPWMWGKEEMRKGAMVVTWAAPKKTSFEKVIEHHINLMAWYGVVVEEAVYASFCNEKGIIASDKEGLKKAFDAGKRLAEL